MRLLLAGLLAGIAVQVSLSQEAQSDGVAWSSVLRLSDGRVFVTDGAITLDASRAKASELPSVELAASTAPIIEGYLAADLPDEFALAELAAGARTGTYQAPSGVTLSAAYVDYLRATVPAGSLRLRMKGDYEPVVIVSNGEAIGLLMPIKR